MRSASNPADVFPPTSGRFHTPVHCACTKILSERGLFRHGPDLYTGVYRSMISQCAKRSRKTLVRDRIRPSGMTASCVLCAGSALFLFLFFFRGLRSFGGATWGVFVWNGGLTESAANVHCLHRVLD